MKFVFLLCFACVYIFGGCSSTLERMINSNIAEIREFIVVGQDDGYRTSLICGYRESDYKINGYATSLIPFGVITIDLNNKESLDFQSGRFVLFVGTEQFNGELEQNPFDKTLVADIGTIIDKSKNIKLDFYINEQVYSVKLNIVDNDWVISSSDCVDLLIENFKDKLKSFIIDNQFNAEIFIKITDDYDEYDSDYFYYISVNGRDGSSINMLISCYTGEVLASNCNFVS